MNSLAPNNLRVPQQRNPLLYAHKFVLQRAGFPSFDGDETSGRRHLRQFVCHDIDIAVLEYHLADTDGERFCRMMSPAKCCVPIIMATGKHHDVDSECRLLHAEGRSLSAASAENHFGALCRGYAVSTAEARTTQKRMDPLA